MSLLSSATVWTNDNVQPKKRVSTMKKSLKSNTLYDSQNIEGSSFSQNDINSYNSEIEMTDGIKSLQSYNNNKVDRVNELINKITYENDGNKLADFQPLTNPVLNKKKDIEGSSQSIKYSANDILPVNPSLTIPVPPSSKIILNNEYSSNGNLGNYSNYKSVYQSNESNDEKPYYAKMGKKIDANNGIDNQLLEKINYMIYLLEEQKNEKTNNVTEEFVLYVFLGVFIIFTVDSFTRVGKYVR